MSWTQSSDLDETMSYSSCTVQAILEQRLVGERNIVGV